VTAWLLPEGQRRASGIAVLGSSSAKVEVLGRRLYEMQTSRRRGWKGNKNEISEMSSS